MHFSLRSVLHWVPWMSRLPPCLPDTKWSPSYLSHQMTELSTFQIIMELLQLMQRCKRCEDELDLRTEKIVGCLLHIWVHLMGTPNLVYINQEFHLNCDISEEWGIPYLMIAGWLVSAKWIIVLACNVLGGGFEMAGQWYIKKNNQPEHLFTDFRPFKRSGGWEIKDRWQTGLVWQIGFLPEAAHKNEAAE